MTKTSTSRHYILIGDEDSWKIALKHQQWGFTQKNRGNWNTIKEGEKVAFYVTTPIKTD